MGSLLDGPHAVGHTELLFLLPSPYLLYKACFSSYLYKALLLLRKKKKVEQTAQQLIYRRCPINASGSINFFFLGFLIQGLTM